jgi:hypothetical protein
MSESDNFVLQGFMTGIAPLCMWCMYVIVRGLHVMRMTIWLEPLKYCQFDVICGLRANLWWLYMLRICTFLSPLAVVIDSLHHWWMAFKDHGDGDHHDGHKLEMRIPKGIMGYTKSYLCWCHSYYVLLSCDAMMFCLHKRGSEVERSLVNV